MALRWGICSAGKISHDFIVALKTLPAVDHKVAAIASRDLKRSEEYAKQHNIPKAYGSYEELAEDPDIDVVYVGSVHTQHHALVLLFLRAKKNVLCEKPMGMNAAEVWDMVQVAKENSVFLMEGFWTRFFPVSEQIRTLLRADETVGIVLNYSGNRQAVLNCTMMIDLPGEALIGGTDGIIKIPNHMNSPTVMFLKGKRWEWPLPTSPEPLFFEHDIGLRYEAEHVRLCLLKGLKESPVMPLHESEIIATISDEARRQVGVIYEQDRVECINQSESRK
ncbi:trans-1,2-dihydrobenzene-1,2-diol dehydrogenase-like isoform X2 [Podarcis muralis]